MHFKKKEINTLVSSVKFKLSSSLVMATMLISHACYPLQHNIKEDSSIALTASENNNEKKTSVHDQKAYRPALKKTRTKKNRLIPLLSSYLHSIQPPHEIWDMICEKITFNEQLKMRLVCKNFNNLFLNKNSIYVRDYPYFKRDQAFHILNLPFTLDTLTLHHIESPNQLIDIIRSPKIKHLEIDNSQDSTYLLEHYVASGRPNLVRQYTTTELLEMTDRRSSLFYAAFLGNLEAVESLVDGFINTTQALDVSASAGHEDVVTFLLNKGASITNNHNTSLELAARNGHLRIVGLLLQRKNYPLQHRYAALELAAKNGRTEVVKLIFDEGIFLKKGDLLILDAAKKGYLDLVKLLIKHHANVNQKDDQGNTAIIYSSDYKHAGITNELLNANANIEPHLLIQEIRSGHINIVKLLIDRGANVNVESQQDSYWQKPRKRRKYDQTETPLICAARYGRDEVIQPLIDNGANVNATCNKGLTALMYAIICGNNQANQAIPLLIKNGANINKKCKERKTPLIYASMYGGIQIIQPLIDKGANVNEKCRYGQTPLMYAISHGDIQTIELLIKNGANVNAKCKKGLTALIYAIRHGDIQTIQLLIKNGANINAKCKERKTPLIYASMYGDIQIIQSLIGKGANVNAKCRYGLTPIIYASMYRCNNQLFQLFQLFQLLIDNGANVNAKCTKGTTTLMYSVRYGDLPLIQLLIDNGANVNAICNKGLTALIYAAEYSRIDTAQLLISKGAYLNSKLVHAARRHCYSRVHDLLSINNQAQES